MVGKEHDSEKLPPVWIVETDDANVLARLDNFLAVACSGAQDFSAESFAHLLKSRAIPVAPFKSSESVLKKCERCHHLN
jgi:hypothetical protein